MPAKRHAEPKIKLTPLGNTMLHSVLQAIVDLHNSSGSTERQIVRQIEAIFIAKGKPRAKHMAPTIMKAIKYAVQQGVIRKKSGKYLLAAGIRACRPIKRKKMQKRPSAQKRGTGAKRTGAKSRKKGTTTPSRRKRVQKAPPIETPKDTTVKPKRKPRRPRRIKKELSLHSDSETSFASTIPPTKADSKQSVNKTQKKDMSKSKLGIDFTSCSFEGVNPGEYYVEDDY